MTRRRFPRSCASTSGSRRNRDLDGDGLIWIVQPDESGLDDSPQFDPIWGGRAHARRDSCCWCGATAGWATTCGGSSTPAARCAAR